MKSNNTKGFVVNNDYLSLKKQIIIANNNKNSNN